MATSISFQIALLQSFLKVEEIKTQYKSQLVGMVLKGYLSLKRLVRMECCVCVFVCVRMSFVVPLRLVVQRTKRIDESQELLLQMLENLTSGTEKERLEFMAVCVKTLESLHRSDMVTPTFIFEQLCSIIRPVSRRMDILLPLSFPLLLLAFANPKP